MLPAASGAIRGMTMATKSAGVSREERRAAVAGASAGPRLEPLLLTVAQTKQVINVGHTKLYELIKERRLDTVKLGKRTLVTVASIKRLAQPGT
jgi:hypothetical protein